MCNSVEPLLSIVLKHLHTDRGMRTLSIDQMGLLHFSQLQSVTFAFPSFIDSATVDRIGSGIAPADRNELLARVAAVRRMRDFARAREDVTHKLALPSAGIYDSVAPQDPEQ